jgi:molecular chaperone GrpE
MKKSNLNVEPSPAMPDPALAGEPSPEAEPLVPVEPSTLNREQLEELKQRAAKADEHWERLLRTTADFDNFKKRAAREKQDAIKFANESLLQKLVPILDNLDMALAATQANQAGDVKALQNGVNMIHQQLKNSLAEAGLEEIEAAGKPFDPNLHEAVSQRETTEVPEGQVVQQLRKGYKLRERLLRPATVVVATAPTA